MKLISPLFFTILLLDSTITFSQTQPKVNPLREKVSSSSIFMGNEPNSYFVFLTLHGHDLKVGDEIDAVNATNKRMTLKITKIQFNDKETSLLKRGQEGSLDFTILKGKMNDFGGDFYLVDKGADFPKESNNTNQTTEAVSNGKAVLTANIDGKPWNAAVVYQGALFYEKGISMMDKSGNPFLQLAFKVAQSPDNRRLTLQIRNFQPNNEKIAPSQLEVLLSGSEIGDVKNPSIFGFNNTSVYTNYSFEMRVLSWKRISADKALLSATFTAKLKGVLEKKEITITNGKIEGLEVMIFTDKF